MSNLHQIGVALQIYGGENRDNLPRSKDAGGSFLWDLPMGTADAITNADARRQVLYCPGRSAKVEDDDYWWNYDSGYRVTGYSWIIERDPASTTMPALQLPPPSAQAKEYLTKLAGTNAAASEMVVDAVISVNGNDFLNIPTANPQKIPYHRSPHMIGGKAQGGNILFQDCHASWRPLKDMKIREIVSNNRQFWF